MKRALSAFVLAVAIGFGLQQLAVGQVVVDPRISGVPRACGVLHVNTTQAGTIANTNETDLWTFTLPGNSLRSDGQGVRVTTGGILGANANSKTIKIYFGATQIAVLTTTANASAWQSTAVVFRTGAATQRANGNLIIALGNVNVSQVAPAETLSGPVVIKMTGQNAVATANDVIFNEALVECL